MLLSYGTFILDCAIIKYFATMCYFIGERWTLICNLCHKDKQNPAHLFFECEEAKKVWFFLEKLLDDLGCAIDLTNYADILLNTVHPTRKHICNFLILLFKQYIYRTKCQNAKITESGLKKEIILTYNIELHNARLSNSVAKHFAKWKLFVNEDHSICDIIYQ